MRSILAAALMLLAAGAGPAAAQTGTPPHAWLFGEWTGGMFPVPAGGVTADVCLAQPVVIFTRDVVLRATLTELLFAQREVETVRATPDGAEFRFRPASSPLPGGTMLGIAPPPRAVGFGCESPDVLHVQRRGPNEIVFPGCAEFPNPLVRCTPR
ncbi:MAG TPA: hypothetical protein VME92_07390 [Acetobacteraceae bacterium]|nr:hypothetical protein [Acetobacteraceae bacterium]